MSNVPDRSRIKEFARSAAYRDEQMRFFRETERKFKETHRAERLDEEFIDFAMSAVLATDEQISAFRAKLDDYRTATVESLLENERQLAVVQKRLEDMLAKAYVLPDGRRVFKTQDGLRVFDEHGAEIGAGDIDPDEIENWRPRADGYLEDRSLQRDLMNDHDKKLDLLERIDEAETRLDDDDLTAADIVKMEQELDASMPLSVRRHIPGFEESSATNAARDFAAAASLMPDLADLKLDMPEFSR